MELEQERLISLIDFAKESAKLKAKPPYSVATHEFHEYEHNLQGLPGLHFDTGEDEEIWLTVDRLHESQAPLPKKPLLALWLEVSNNPAKEPILRSAVEFSKLLDAGFVELPESEESVDIKQLILLPDFAHKAEVEALLRAYVSTQWTPWAAEEKKRRRTIHLYGKLFTLKQQLEGAITDAQVEVAWGVGMAIWAMGTDKVCYPLLSRLVDISVNEDSKAIEIRPRGLEARLELDIFTDADNPGTAELEKAFKQFTVKAAQTFSPFDGSTFDGILHSAVACLDSKGVYWPAETTADDRTLPSPTEALRVTNTWVIVARPRSKSLFVQDLERFKAEVEDEVAASLPKAILAVLTDPADTSREITLPSFRGLSIVQGNDRTSAEPSGKKASELYFPMPFNEEQVRIVQMLEVHDGVVVQGPPGTGKTHTIANIIAHYFALGKRVLVTSMKEPALAVLRDKLPEEIRPLAISLLSNEQEGMDQFKNAIDRIASEIQCLNKSAYQKEIVQLEQTIDRLQGKIASVDWKISDWAKKNLNPVVLDQDSILPVDAATEVLNGQGHYEWLKDKLPPENTPLFSNEDIVKLRQARRAVVNDMHYLGVALPQIATFHDSRELLRIHQDLSRDAQLQTAIESGDLPSLADSKDETLEGASILLQTIRDFLALGQKIRRRGTWHAPARTLLKQSSETLPAVIGLFDTLGDELKATTSERNNFLAKPVVLPGDAELNEEIIQAIDNKAAGKSAFGLSGLIGKAAAKKKLEEIRILASAPQTQDEWRHIQAYVSLRKRCREQLIRWNRIALELNIECFEEAEPDHVLMAAEFHSLHLSIRDHISLEQEIACRARLIIPAWARHSEIEEDETCLLELERFLDSHICRRSLANAWAGKHQLNRILSGYNGKIIDDLKDFVSASLGNPSVTDSDLQAKWSHLIAELTRIQSLRSAFDDIREISGRIEESGAKEWATELRSERADSTVDTLLPDNWQRAWRLRRLATYLENADSRQELKRLTRERTSAEGQLAKSYRDIVAKRTWLKLADNATPDVRCALEAYRDAVRQSKGTGKRAAISRQNARAAAERANHAIPCWIMPHWRVSESLPAQLGCFDLVIIDEASQSDLAALPALLRAQKILIVGDDKQVSPDPGFMEVERIENLMARYLKNQVELFRPQMDPGRSMYHLFKVVFAQSGIMLKEHFRCVGPIIEYSKREFYDHQLMPVRLPKLSERLDPPLIDVVVEDGYRDGDSNISEARFIVDEIKRICADESMRQRTMGVVSLLADKQALKIWTMLKEELGPEEIERHEIACGDARTFQGKERDIMFLSMVVSPGRAHAQTNESTEQRFNVAASRARDRMYLVRSIGPDQLSPVDRLRRNLISHFASPFAQHQQRVENLRSLCESDFEREVYDILAEKGYRVTPQVKVGQYRIDLVVEGDNDARLAVECDGDRYHGPDRWEDDINRQRVLERVGWQFWRSFASNFVRNRKEVVADLIATLTERGVEPIGSETGTPSIHTEQRRVTAFPPLQEPDPESFEFDSKQLELV